MNMNEIAEHQNVKINTIEDHVLEIFIKGYQNDYNTYVNQNKLINLFNIMIIT